LVDKVVRDEEFRDFLLCLGAGHRVRSIHFPDAKLLKKRSDFGYVVDRVINSPEMPERGEPGREN